MADLSQAAGSAHIPSLDIEAVAAPASVGHLHKRLNWDSSVFTLLQHSRGSAISCPSLALPPDNCIAIIQYDLAPV